MQVNTKRNQNIEGTGLGLAIAKQLCIAMGGDISVKSEYGKGCEFTVIIQQGLDPDVSFSLVGDINGKQDYLDSANASCAIRFAIPNARLLVVDDIATNLKVAEGLLAPYKARVDICLSGAEAIELIKCKDYDLVFMDHMMPEMDGIETCGAIRMLESERFKSMPIIALTANAVSGMREMFLEKGFNDFLSKPIDISKLDEILERWIPKGKKEERVERKLILLVDENMSNLKKGVSALEEKYDVITAPSIEKMQKILESNKPDLIMMNGNMSASDDLPIILIPEPFEAATLIAIVENNI